MVEKGRLLVVLGPTASGKSALAVRLAKKLGGEIISADSRQVYRGLDIGSGKITRAEMAGVPHWLLDIASPKRQFSVARYQELAQRKITEIWQRGRLPIICGGTGFYIQSIVDDLILPRVRPNLRLRTRLAKLDVAELFARLEKLDPARAARIDRHNPRRLIRAIEVALAQPEDSPPGGLPEGSPPACPPALECLQLGLKLKPDRLRARIHKRLLARLRAGMVEEVARLHAQGVSWQRLESFGLEYGHIARWLQERGKKSPRKEIAPPLEQKIWHYAKRQLTWFKRDPRIHWITSYVDALKVLRAQRWL